MEANLKTSFIVGAAALATVAVLALTGNASFFWTHTYYMIAFLFIMAGFVLVIARLLNIRKLLPDKHSLRDLYYLVLIPLGLLPFLECPYKVPFVFCKVCPRKCPWGEARPLLVPAMLVQNIDNRHWCFNFCPLGRFQDLQSAVVPKRLRLPAFIIRNRNAIRYFFLSATIFLVLKSYYGGAGWFFNGPTTVVTATFIIISGLSFFIPRLWCNYICPIGTFSELTNKMTNEMMRCCRKNGKTGRQ